MAVKFSIEAVFKAVDRMTAPITRMGNRVGKVTRGMQKNLGRVNDKLQSIGKSARGAFGVAGIAGAAFAAQRVIRSVIDTGKDFEQTMVGAASRFPEGIERGSDAFRELEGLARQLGATTEFTATEAAGGLNFLAKAGFSAAESMQLLPGLVDLATASEMDLARVSDIASDSIGAFGLEVADFSSLSDKMAKTVTISNQNMEQLFETIKKGGPAATAAGAPLEEFLALTASLAGAGLKASDAGTALKNIYLKLATINVQDTLAGLGVDALDPETRELRAFADIMDDLVISTADLSSTERVGLINKMFGLRGVTGVASILANGVQGVRDFQKAIEDSTGFTRALALLLRDTLSKDMDALSAASESAQLTFFGQNVEGMRALTQGITGLLRGLDSFIARQPGISKMTAKFTALSVVALGLGLIFAGIAAAISFIAGSTFALFGLAAAGVAAVGLSIANMNAVESRDFFASGIDIANRKKVSEEANQRKTALFGGAEDRFGRALDRFSSGGLATLEILAPPGTAKLSGGLGPAFNLTFDDFEFEGR